MFEILTSRQLKTSLVLNNRIQVVMALQVYQGPVIQSIVSLTSILSGQLVKCYMTL